MTKRFRAFRPDDVTPEERAEIMGLHARQLRNRASFEARAAAARMVLEAHFA